MADDTAELIQRILARGPTEEDLARKRSMESENVGQFFKDAWGNLKGIVKTPYDVLEKGIPATFGDPGAGRRARQAASEAAAMGYPVAQSVIPGAAPTGALPAPQAAPVAPPAPAAVAPVARARALPPQAGAIGMVPQAQANALEGAIPPQATPVAAPVAPPVAPVAAPVVPKSTLVEEYSKALEKLKTTDTSVRLTAEQQYRSELSFWLNMLAAASEPGARAGGAIGKAGAAALEGMTKQETENKKAAMEMLKSNKEDVYRIAMLGDKEADNARELERIGITKEHYKALEDNDKAKIGLLTKQLTMGGDEVKSAPILKNGNIGLITNSGKITDTGVKARVPHEADTRGEMEKTLASLRKNFPTKTKTEQELFDTYIGVKTAGKEERDRQDELVNKAVVDMLKDPMFRGTAAEARARVLSGMPGAQAVGLLRFNTLEEARAAKKAGKIKAGDTIMTPTGPIVVQ